MFVKKNIFPIILKIFLKLTKQIVLKKENVMKDLQASLEVFIYQESEPGMIYL